MPVGFFPLFDSEEAAKHYQAHHDCKRRLATTQLVSSNLAKNLKDIH